MPRPGARRCTRAGALSPDGLGFASLAAHAQLQGPNLARSLPRGRPGTISCLAIPAPITCRPFQQGLGSADEVAGQAAGRTRAAMSNAPRRNRLQKGERCRLLPVPGFSQEIQDDRFSSPTQNIRGQGQNELASCKRKQRPSASFSSLIDPDHKRMSRMLGFALTLDTADAWQGFAFVALTRMSEAERVALAFWALTTLDDDTAYLTASAALFGMGDEVAA